MRISRENAREGIAYLIFGICTTLINYLAYFLADRLIGNSHYLICNLLAWICAVIFAFCTNRKYVFRSEAGDPAAILKEMLRFLASRLFSLGVEEAGLWFLNSGTGLGTIAVVLCGVSIRGTDISKIIMSVIVILLNYILGRMLVFRRRTER